MTPNVTPDDISWRGDVDDHPSLRCPACGYQGPQAPVLAVPSMVPPHPTLTLLRCSGCGSSFFDPPGIADFSDINQNRDDFWRHYVECLGGIWDTIWPVLAAGSGASRSLLDVGCGFGYAVDFWQRTGLGQAIGVELAEYGRIGAERLGITVHRELLQDCAALAGRRFDVVYASEVVEHVADPAGFVAMLAGRVAADGVLVLTTPSAAYVRRENASMTLLAALAPGFHGFLLSADRFGELARAAGMPFVEVRAFGERQVLWASRRPLAIELDLARLRPPYTAYMESRVDVRDPSSPVWQGFAWRLLRDRVHDGRLHEAALLGRVLAQALEGAYGPEVVRLEAMVGRVAACGTLADVGRIAPYFLPQFYYAQGIVAEVHARDAERARSHYRACVDLASDLGRRWPLSFLEATSMLWLVRVREAALDLSQGELARAAQTYAEVARAGFDCAAGNGYAVAAPGLIDEAVPRGCEALFLAQRPDLAQQVFDAYLANLGGRSPGTDWTSPATADAALAGHAPEGAPADPLFPLFFAGLLDHARGSDDRLAALHQRAVRPPRNPALAARLAHYAAIAARYVPPPERKPLFESSFTLRPPAR